MIVNLYIDIGDVAYEALEAYLHAAGYAFYDASYFDPYIKKGYDLDDIEIDLECK